MPIRLRSSINVQWLEPDVFNMPVPAGADQREARIIQIVPDQVVTHEIRETPPILDHLVVSDPQRDLLKIAVIERHAASQPISLSRPTAFDHSKDAYGDEALIVHPAHRS